jgi:hypothetical protein
MIFLDLVGKYHKNVKFIVNDLLLNLGNLECIVYSRQQTRSTIGRICKEDRRAL